VGFMGFDRLTMMRRVNAAAAPLAVSQTAHGGEEASAAVNHRQRMAAEQQRRLELALMSKEDYTGTPEGQERLQRQEERSRLREEELLMRRVVEAEKQAARALQRAKELEEEKRVKEQYLAKIRAQREQQAKEAKEKDAARQEEMERKMKALKEAADAKARAEFAARQHALEEEARVAREKQLVEVDNAQMQVEDVLGHAMQQEVLAERERQRQIVAEQEEWRLFQEREQDKQRDATQLRRAAMAQQYEQDKQRRIQIHKLQKERAAQQAERRETQSRQVQERQLQDEAKARDTDEDSRAAPASRATPTVPATSEELTPVQGTEEEATPTTEAVNSSAASVSERGEAQAEGDVEATGPDEVRAADAKAAAGDQTEPPQVSSSPEQEEPTHKDEQVASVEQDARPEETQVAEASEEKEAVGSASEPCATLEEASRPQEAGKGASDSSPLQEDEEASKSKPDEDSAAVATEEAPVDKTLASTRTQPSVGSARKEQERPAWSLVAAREQGFLPFAQVLSVVESSPAMQATLQSGDLLVEFGGIVSSTPKCLMAMAECVQKNVNKAIPVALLRARTADTLEEVRVELRPRKWQGKGLLGCQLSPFKWPEDEEDAARTKETEGSIASTEDASSSDDEGASALVVYDVTPASVAEQAGLANGDLLAGCEGMTAAVSVSTLSEVVGHIQATRAASAAVYLDINRWVEQDQCYRTVRIVLPPSEDSGPLGFALTSFAEYYNYYPTSDTTASACAECYYTSLTTALHAAALSGHVSCLAALLHSLQNGDGGGYTASDYLDWRDEDGRTPLFYACYAGQLECVRYLVSTTQSVSSEKEPFISVGVDLYGDTVLHAASTSGNVAVVSLLIERGCAQVDDRNHTRMTCAHVAPNVETLAFLGEKTEADLLATDSEERMPLAYACLRNDVDSIEYLCNKHPDFVDYADVRGNTPLHVAAWLGLQEAAEVLIRFLPSIALYITNEDGQNAAEVARSSGMADVAAFLESVMAAIDSNQ
jgi:ankyrin repeat protein